MKTVLLILSTFLLAIGSLSAQHLSTAKGQSALGVGIGLPFGGFGGRLSYNPADHLSLFGGLGYNLVGIGANAGLELSIPSEKQSEFYFTGMYGYNAVIAIKNTADMGGIFAGPSFGMGLKINSLRSKGNYWDIGMLVPMRSQKYKDTILEMDSSPYIKIESKPWPVLFYFGHHFNISAK